MKLFILNAIVVSVLTVGSFSAMYAAFSNPKLPLTSVTLAPIIAGFATIIITVANFI